MNDNWLCLYLVAMGVIAFVWIRIYHAILRRLAARHLAQYTLIYGTPTRRKNGMDRFFSLVGFLFQDQTPLNDGRLFLQCLTLKVLPVLFFFVFVAMMYTPLFLRLS